MRKIISIMLVFCIMISFASTSVNAQQNHEEIILELNSEIGLVMTEIKDIIDNQDVLVWEVRGKTIINGENITFGMFNADKLPAELFYSQIDNELNDIVKQYSSNDDIKTINQAKKYVKFNILSFSDTSNKIKQVSKKSASTKKTSDIFKNKKVKSKEISKIDRREWESKNLTNRGKSNDVVYEVPLLDDESHDMVLTAEELKNYKEETKSVIDKKKKGLLKDVEPSSVSNKSSIQTNNNTINNTDTMVVYAAATTPTPTPNPKGGPSYTDNPSNPSGANPYCGDRQDRLKQKRRFNESGDVASWIPTWVKATTSVINSSTNERQIKVEFKWDSTSLSNLVMDSNEAIEAEVLFYNYGSGMGVPGNGKAWMSSFPPKSWSTNLPNGYLDTRFMDSSDERSYAVGTRYPQNMTAGTTYQFTMNAFPESGQSGSGLWQVNFQRGYYHDSTDPWYRAIRGTGDEWFVFNEEYESTVKIKQYHKFNSRYYAPCVFNENSANTYATQFRYKESFNSISSGSNVDTGSIPSGGYKVYRLQVNSGQQYQIKTTKYGTTSSDTYLSLYNHDFTEIAYNDDSNGTLYSQIDRYLPSGDYYIVVRGYGWSSMRSYLNVSIQTSIGLEKINVGEIKYIDIPQNGSKSYSFDATSSVARTFKTGFWQASGDTYLYLYDNAGNLLASNDDSNGTLYSTINYNVIVGRTYIVKVTGYNNSAVKCTLTVQ